MTESTEAVEMAPTTSDVKTEVESVASPTSVPASPGAAAKVNEDKASPSKNDQKSEPKVDETAATVEATQPPLAAEDEKMDTEVCLVILLFV